MDTEAMVSLVRCEDGWHILLTFDGGQECVSHEAFDTQQEAETRLRAWCAEMGFMIPSVH